MWWVTIVFICYLYCVNVILHIRYCNIWWCVCRGYVKYSVWRPITNIHENMANIISTGCGSGWRWIWGFNGGRGYLRYVWCVHWWRKVVLTVCRVWCGVILEGIYRSRGGIGKMDGLCVWVETWEMFALMSAFG